MDLDLETLSSNGQKSIFPRFCRLKASASEMPIEIFFRPKKNFEKTWYEN